MLHHHHVNLLGCGVHIVLQSLINGQLLLDPTSVEMARQEGSLLLAMMPSSNEVIHSTKQSEVYALQTHTYLLC